MLNIVEVQKTLLANARPSGHEKATGDVIQQMIKPFVDEMHYDAMGNLIALKKGNGKNKIMISGHMDTIGMMVTNIDKDGFVFFDALGGFNPQSLVGVKVRFMNGTVGTINVYDDKEKVTLGNLYIDLGGNKEEVEKVVSIGDIAIYQGELQMMMGNNIMGPYMDDLIACSVMICVLSKMEKCENDVYFVFSTQEEVGTRGAKTSAYSVDPDWAFCIDVTPTGDYPACWKPKMPMKLGGGIGIKVKDSSVICSIEILNLLKKCAKDNNIPYQLEVLRGGGTDAGAIIQTRSGVLTGGIAIPCRYVHSPSEIVNLDDLDNAIKLTLEAIKVVR